MNTSFALGSLLVLVAATVGAQDYAIKMQYPAKVGQRFHLTAVGSQSSENSMTSGTRVIKNQKEELSLEMESEVTVLAVDAKGRPTKESHKIAKLLQGADKTALLAPGTTVVASRPEHKLVFEIAGEPAVGDVAKALDLAISITSGGPTDDEIFGTTERKKVGDRWSMNEALALQDANSKFAGGGVKVSAIKGTVTLEKVTKVGATDVLHLSGDMKATLASSGTGPFTSMDSTLTSTLSGAFPVNSPKSLREESMTMTMVMKASGKPNPDGPEMQISGKQKRTVTRKLQLLD